jgi:hypothetical protein
MRVAGPIALLALVACAALRGPPGYWQANLSNTSYKLSSEGWQTTPGGVLLWDPRKQVEVPRLDRIVSELETCIASLSPTREQLVSGACPVAVPWAHNGFRRDWFEVAVAPDWYASSCTGAQVFPCYIAPSDCEQAKRDKPELVGKNCDCACRATIQNNRTIVTTPNMQLLPGTLFSLVTGCTNPWHAPFSACTAPPR